MDLGLAGVPAVVAGASRGIGHAIALELAREGARVAICSRHPDESSTAAQAIHSETGTECSAITADVSTPAGASSFIDSAASKLGGLQVLVTNAGGPPLGTGDSHDDETWLEALNLNFLSAVRMVRAALPHMRKAQWGRIVCITSYVVKHPDVALSLSSAARSATTAFAKSMAATVGAEGITVNCVMPGQILTDRLRDLAGAPPDAGADHDSFKAMTEKIPAGRIGTTAELASVVAFLCSQRASFVNGVNLAVDGGYLRSI